MRAPVLLALNAVVAVAAIVVYDSLRADPAPAAGAKPADTSAIESRLAALEAKLGGLAAQRADRSLATRVAEIETRLAAAAPAGGASSSAAAGASSETAAGAAGVTGATGGAGNVADPNAPVTEADVARFRRLQERADAEREKERLAQSLDALLRRLNLQLTPAQRDRLLAETTDFRAKLREIFPGGGPGGGPGGMGGGMGGMGGRTPEEAFAAVRELQTSYTSKLEEFLPSSDAAAIASSMTPQPRGPGAPGGGNSGGGGRPRDTGPDTPPGR